MLKAAMILAAGRGERMRPLTDHTPKPLLPVGGRPLIVWHLQKLVRAGFTRVVINHAHLGEQIENALGDGRDWGIELRYSHEITALETAGGIATALPLIDADLFPVVNGDVYCDFDFRLFAGIMHTMQHESTLAHLVLVDNPSHHPSGDFVLEGTQVGDKKPAEAAYTFSGIGVYKRALFDATPANTKAPLAPLLKAAMRAGDVTGEHYPGRWVDVGTPERLTSLDNELTHQAC